MPTPQAMAASIAEKFVKAGAHVIFFPRGTKRCTVLGWEQKATNDLQVALEWAAQDPSANVGIVGKQDGLWGLDDDAGLLIEYEAQHGPIQTYGTRTVSGGRHFIFRQSEPSWAMGNISIEDERGHELLSARVSNRYVVAAGSWAYPFNDTTQPLSQYTAVDPSAPFTDAPASLLAFIREKAADYSTKAKPQETAPDLRIYHEGGRNNALTRKAGKLREAGANEDEILVVLTRLNAEQCVPALRDQEVASIAKSIGKYPPGEDKALELNQKADTQPVQITSDLLEREFPAYDGEEPKELPMLVTGFMPEGVSFFGSLAGTGKTWAGLSLAKALTTGMPLWGMFEVPEKIAVLYLIPEASDSSFKRRLKKMGIPQDKTLFRFRTISQGMTRPLTDPLTLAMVRELGKGKRKVLVVVDTAVRFLRAESENNAMENSLMHDSEVLRAVGVETGASVSVLFQHHSPKALKDAADMTLENVLRGTGDFGAMADCVYGLRRDEDLYAYGEGPEQVEVVNVKPRDFKPPLPFRLAFSRRPRKDEVDEPISLIDTTADLQYHGNSGLKDVNAGKLIAMLKDNPLISFNDLTKELKMKRQAVKDLAHSRGWVQRQRSMVNSDGSAKIKDGKQRVEWYWSNSIITMPEPAPVAVVPATEASTVGAISLEDAF